MFDDWFACEHPERSNSEGNLLWHYTDCRGCALKADATLRQIDADPGHRAWLEENVPQVFTILDRIMRQGLPA